MNDARVTVNTAICSRFESRGKSLGSVSVVSICEGDVAHNNNGALIWLKVVYLRRACGA